MIYVIIHHHKYYRQHVNAFGYVECKKSKHYMQRIFFVIMM
jgi:hypothetical protein